MNEWRVTRANASRCRERPRGSATRPEVVDQSGPAKVKASIIPGGGIFFIEGKDTHAPRFGNYELGGSVTVNLNRYLGVEGEVSGELGVSQSLDFAGASLSDTPLLNYSGNLIVHVTRGPVVPYVTGEGFFTVRPLGAERPNREKTIDSRPDPTFSFVTRH